MQGANGAKWVAWGEGVTQGDRQLTHHRPRNNESPFLLRFDPLPSALECTR